MAYDPNSPLSLAEQTQRSQAFAGLEKLLGKVAPFALEYEAVIAEGYSATVPTLGVSTLVTLLRINNGLTMPTIGHIKSRHGPISTYPELAVSSGLDEPAVRRCILVTECIYRGKAARNAVEKLRRNMPVQTLIDVAAMTDSAIGGSDVVESVQMDEERLIIGGRSLRDIAAGNYFWSGKSGQDIPNELKLRAVALGRTVAERFLDS